MALLTVEQAAERLGTGERYVRRLVAENRIEFVKLGGTMVRCVEEVLEEFSAAGRVPARPRQLRLSS
jgi:excisionase family DNA binding protein